MTRISTIAATRSLAIFVAGVVFLASQISQAAPLSFRFEAVIDQVTGDPQSLTPQRNFAVGDRLSALLEFPSSDLLPGLVDGRSESGLITVKVSGDTYKFHINTSSINQGMGIDLSGGTPNAQVSSLSLSRFNPTNSIPNYGYIFLLTGPAGILNGPEDATNLELLNQLNDHREFGISFTNASATGTQASFTARVGTLIAVPEPSSLAVVMGAMLLGLGTRRRY